MFVPGIDTRRGAELVGVYLNYNEGDCLQDVGEAFNRDCYDKD